MANKRNNEAQECDSWVFSSGFDGNGDYFEWIIERLGEDEFEIHCESMGEGDTEYTRGTWDQLRQIVFDYSEGDRNFNLQEFLKEIGRAEEDEDEEIVPIEPEPEPLVLPPISDDERERFCAELRREIDKRERIPAHGYGNAGAWQYFREKSKQEYERTFGTKAPAWVQKLTWMRDYLSMSIARGIPLPETMEIKE